MRATGRGAKQPATRDAGPVDRDAALTYLTEALEKVLDGLPIVEPAHLDLVNTPRRVARMYYDELLSSYRKDKEAEFLAKLTTFDADGYDEIVLVALVAGFLAGMLVTSASMVTMARDTEETDRVFRALRAKFSDPTVKGQG